ncbi:MAG: prevent-host-death protein [Thiothrix sp.]|nr:MAG: prevent-host-death protein [Thiothrix sp.]
MCSYIKGEPAMQVVNIRQLKANPSVALREAKQDLMLVTNRDKPDALLVSMEQLAGIPNLEQVRLVLAIALFRDKLLSIAAAAKVAGVSLAEMLTIVSDKGIPVVDFADDADAEAELNYAENWLKAH